MAGNWSQLDPRTRRVIIVVGVAETALKAAALVDLARRPADQVHGRKFVWATALSTISSAGVLPIAYFLFGRRGR